MKPRVKRKKRTANNLEFGTRGSWTTPNSISLTRLHQLLLLTNLIAIATLLGLCNKLRHTQKVIENLEPKPTQLRSRTKNQTTNNEGT